MLGSRKLKAALSFFLCLTCLNLSAEDLRYYLILQAGDGEAHDYIGSVTINDDIQSLAAQVFFSSGRIVYIEMDIQTDGITVSLQINTGAGSFTIETLSTPLTSSFSGALQASNGKPSDWLAVPGLTRYEFRLPAISSHHRIKMDKQAKNFVEGIGVRFNKKFPAEIRNMGYKTGSLYLNPGLRTSGRHPAIVRQMTDEYLFQLFELMIVALVSPQLVVGRYFSSRYKRNSADPLQKLPLSISVSDRTENKVNKKEKVPGYMLWIWSGVQWVQQSFCGVLPKGFTASPPGCYGVILTPQGIKPCFVKPLMMPTGSGVDSTVEQLVQQLGGMNIGVPPQNCRSGDSSWRGGDGFGGGPGPGWGGGGASGFTTH